MKVLFRRLRVSKVLIQILCTQRDCKTFIFKSLQNYFADTIIVNSYGHVGTVILSNRTIPGQT